MLQAAKTKAAEAGKRVYTKTSLMLGIGETRDEVLEAMADMRAADVDVLTLGQYLRPTEHHLAVVDYVTPGEFEWYREQAEAMGFRYVASGPMVRSSYKAGEFFMEAMLEQDEAVGGEATGVQAATTTTAPVDAVAEAKAWLVAKGIHAPEEKKRLALE